jgi:UDP-GlcNAc:undecaprenyl-phosphate/decaprenyl-phosphate GlcNAc-1-phosphate transferase
MSIQCLSGFAALLVCLAALPAVKRFAQNFHLFDSPGPLKIHQGSIPRIGGIAMFAGFLAGCATLYLPAAKPSLLPLAVFATIWVVGLIDDVRTLLPLFRFVVQIACGSALWIAGWRLQWFDSPILDLLFTSLFVAFVTNAMNLLDGMDGLAAGTASIVCVGFLIISAGHSSSLEFTIAASLLGACIGMLRVNTPPAKMFMGDSGSTLIGIVLAFLALNWVRSETDSRSIFVPLVFFSLFLADAVLAILRRARSRQGLFTGDRRHFYDILLQRGWSVEGVLRFSVCATGILIFGGWLCARGITGAWSTGLVVALALAIGAYFLDSLQPDLTTVQASHQEHSLGSVVD